MKKIIKLNIIVFIFALFCITPFYASAANATLEEIIDIYEMQCNMQGESLSAKEIKKIRKEVKQSIKNYAKETSISFEDSSQIFLEEITLELYESIDMYGISTCSKDDNEGNVQLPYSLSGDIFFTDNDAAWNHVGMYTSSFSIIEAMPSSGVKEKYIWDKSAYQQTTGESHDQSCILRVKDIDDETIYAAIEWALLQENKEYDDDFMFNKECNTKENKKFNCSELVWKAFYYATDKKLDLDSNGGLAVYPNNIKKSPKVKEIEKF